MDELLGHRVSRFYEHLTTGIYSNVKLYGDNCIIYEKDGNVRDEMLSRSRHNILAQRLAAIEKMRRNQTKSKTIIFIKHKNNIPAQFTWFSKIPVGNLWKL